MNKNKQITFRLSDKQYAYVLECSEIYNETPSKFLCRLIDSARYNTAAQQSFFEGLQKEEGNSQ